jgi:ABC-2 type transport system ATP-binding protein
MPRIELSRLSCMYQKSPRFALQDISLGIPEGVTGIVGPNGAGKTTLLRAILGLVSPVAGQVSIDGVSPRQYLARGRIGLVPDAPAFDGFLTTAEFLEGLSALMPGTPMVSRVSPVDIRHLWDCRLDSISLGERRRVELAAALLGNPDLLLLDEPTNGLDPRAIMCLREDLLSQERPGRTTLVSSHHLDELQRVVKRVLILSDGKVMGLWEVDDAIREFGSFDAMFKSLIADSSTTETTS